MASKIVKIRKVNLKGELYALQINSEKFLTAYGEVINLKKISSVRNTRNVPPNIREKFYEIEKVYKEELKNEDKLEKLEHLYKDKISNLKKQRENLGEELKSMLGLLTINEFKDVFRNNLSNDIRQAIKMNGYSINMPNLSMYSKNINLYIERTFCIDKYYGEDILSYREYDGALFLVEDAEKYPVYAKYIKKYSRKLPISNKIKLNEFLDIGGEGLYYNARYTIPFDGDLTRDNAIALAKKCSK